MRLWNDKRRCWQLPRYLHGIAVVAAVVDVVVEAILVVAAVDDDSDDDAASFSSWAPRWSRHRERRRPRRGGRRSSLETPSRIDSDASEMKILFMRGESLIKILINYKRVTTVLDFLKK